MENPCDHEKIPLKIPEGVDRPEGKSTGTAVDRTRSSMPGAGSPVRDSIRITNENETPCNVMEKTKHGAAVRDPVRHNANDTKFQYKS